MTGADGREILGGGGALPVDVRALGAELRRLWEAAGGEAGGAVTRACTRNVVALCPDEAAAATAARALAGVADRYPSRAFVVCAAPGDAGRLDATLAAHCTLRGGGRHVCCEQITLAVGRAAGRRAASAIVPLLVPDLPVFVWTLGTPQWGDETMARLLDVADGLVFDSRACDDAPRLVVDLAHRERRDRWAPADFEWGRLADWREAVALLFDEPAAAPLAALATRVIVSHGPDTTVGAALLAGWVADRLAAARDAAAPGVGARAAAGDATGEDAPADVALEAAPGDAGIVRVRIEVARPAATFEVERAPGGHTLRFGVAAPGGCMAPAHRPCEEAPLERLLEDRLAAPGPDALYESALARAATLLGGFAPDEGAGT